MKKILIIGFGGREHALAWKIAQSHHVKSVFVAPGNAGTLAEQKVKNIPIGACEYEKLLTFAKQENIHLTIVGPEQPLADGLVDLFQQNKLVIFGPNKKAAQLEGSKIFCKQLLKKYNIPTACYQEFSDSQAAYSYLEQQTFPLVIKADGLAAGKGVVICQNLEHAKQSVKAMLMDKQFGTASQKIIIEQFIRGIEASFIVAASGKHYIEMASSQDHKARDNNDQGPNTGGMGAYSPAPIIEESEIREKIIHQIIEPTLQGLIKEGIHYCGFLYAGLMIDEQKNVHILEYNCRMGDPETQPILMRLNSDLYTLIDATLNQTKHTPAWCKQSAISVVMATQGYPNAYPKNTLINNLPPDTADKKIFHAGTALNNQGTLISTGGRVLNVSARDHSLKNAQQQAYQMVDQIDWPDSFYRTDIGNKGL